MSIQTIRHGATIETATPAEVAAIVASSLDQRTSDDQWRLKDSTIITAAGTGQTTQHAPAQFDWELERWNIGPVPAADAGVAVLYLDQVEPAAYLATLTPGAIGTSAGYSPRIIIPANGALIVSITGATAGDSWSWNFQIRRIRS